jgi:AraC-like DNA-binding protein
MAPLADFPPMPWSNPYPLFCWVVTGTLQMLFNGQWLNLLTGQGAFVPAHTLYAGHAALGDQITPCDVLWFSVMPFGVLVHRCQLTPKEHRKSPHYTCLGPFFWDLVQWWQQARHPLLRQALLLTFFSGLLETPVIPGRLTEKVTPQGVFLPLPLQRALRWLRSAFDKPLHLAQLAEHCGISPAYLCRLFRRHLGMTPAECQRQIRLNIARQLAEQTTLSAADIAYLVGYHNLAAFLRAFRKTFGRSITQLRLKVKSPRAPSIPKTF